MIGVFQREDHKRPPPLRTDLFGEIFSARFRHCGIAHLREINSPNVAPNFDVLDSQIKNYDTSELFDIK